MFVVNRFIFLMMLLQLDWSFCLGKQSEVNCLSPQYLEIGTTSPVTCSFQERFFAVLWYNNTNSNEPIIHYQNINKSGTGDSLEHYDIDRNGQLIIKNVSIEHEGNFTVAYVRLQNEFPVFRNVAVIVIAKSSTPFPVFDICDKGSNKYFCEVEQSLIRCSVFNARPAVELTLASRTLYGDRNISNDMIITKRGKTYTSSVTTKDELRHSSLLNLVVCKASSLPGVLEENESLMLAHTGKTDFSNRIPTRIYIERYNKLELSCSHSLPSFGVWKKGSSLKDDEFELLMYFVLIEEAFQDVLSPDVTLGNNGSLIIPAANISHEGFYFCISGDGMTDDVTLYEVFITVRPIPKYPIVEGCPDQQYCVLERQHEGNLLCTVQGIRPKVQLKWRALLESDKHSIVFKNQQSVIEEDGETFTIKVSATYLIKDKSIDRMTVQCLVISPEHGLLNKSTKMDLVFREGVNTTRVVWIVYSSVTTTIILVGILGGVLLWNCRRDTSDRGDESDEERTTLRGTNSVI